MSTPPQARERVDVEGLREKVAMIINEGVSFRRDHMFGRGVTIIEGAEHAADAILALPEIASLKAAVEVARGALRRVVRADLLPESLTPRQLRRCSLRLTFTDETGAETSWAISGRDFYHLAAPALNAATLSGEAGNE